MGLFSSSSKKTEQHITNIYNDDDIVTALDGDTDAQDSNVANISGVRDSHINLQTTDHGTVKNALSTVLGINRDSIDFSADVAGAAFEYGDRLTENTLGVVGQSLGEILDFGSEAMQRLDDTNEDALNRVGATSQSAITAVTENAQTETTKLFSQISQLAMWGIGAIAAVMVVVAWRQG